MSQQDSGADGGAMQGTDVVHAGAVSLIWNARTRLAVMRFAEPTVGTGPAAEILVGAMERWVDSDRPFGLLADTRNNPSVDAQWRARWGMFFKAHKSSSVLAVFNMGATLRVLAELFRRAVGLQLKGFEREEDARAWLRAQGIGA